MQLEQAVRQAGRAEQAGRQVKAYQGGQGRADQARIQVVWQGRSGSQCRAGRKVIRQAGLKAWQGRSSRHAGSQGR
jgi:hypothetical protein